MKQTVHTAVSAPDTSITPAAIEMSQLRKALTSGAFAAVATATVALGVVLVVEISPSPRMIGGVALTAFSVGLAVAWAQWTNHIRDERKEYREAMELRWPEPVPDAPETVTNLRNDTAPIGMVEVPHENGWQPRKIMITKETANAVYEIILSNGWIFSRSKLVGNGLPLTRDEYDELRKILLAHGMIENISTGKLTERGQEFLMALGQLYRPPHRK